jgi:hypothetical protein
MAALDADASPYESAMEAVRYPDRHFAIPCYLEEQRLKPG